MKILLISEYFAPVNAVASIRWTKLSKYLAESHRCEITLLTNEKTFNKKYLYKKRYMCNETSAEENRHLQKIVYLPSTFLISGVNVLNNIAKDLMSIKKAIDKNRLKKVSNQQNNEANNSNEGQNIRYRAHLWFNSMLDKAYLQSIKKLPLNTEEYDVIISSYGPLWTHAIALQIKQTKPDLVWLADFRDSPFVATTNSKTVNKTVKSILEKADIVSGVSAGVIDSLGIMDSDKGIVIYNGYDLSDYGHELHADPEYVLNEEKFNLVYTGTIYRYNQFIKSELTPCFRALRSLISEGRIEARDIEVIYAGKTETEFFSQITCFPELKSKSFGFISRDACLFLQRQSAILLMCTFNTARTKGILCGKVYEYMQSSRPVLCICSGDEAESASKEMISKSSIGFCYEEINDKRDFEEMKAFLDYWYKRWLKRKDIKYEKERDVRYVKTFDYCFLASTLFDVLKSKVNQAKRV